MARTIMPGPEPLGRFGSILLGMVGAAVGGGLVLVVDPDVWSRVDVRAMLMAVNGALVTMLCYRAFAMRAAA